MAELETSNRTPLSSSRRHSRRSTGNISFSHLSLSPLTSASITEQDFKKKGEKGRPGSYIQGISAPTTPGVLSRNQSFTSQHSFYNELPKSKSSSHLTTSQLHSTSNQWLQRTGAALTSETRESKGQSWLTSRASSTSLVREGEDDDGSIYYGADDEFSPLTPRRRLSRNLSGEFYATGLEALEEGSPTGGDIYPEREDWAEDEDDEYIDIPRGFGVGQFVDRLIGWSVFADDDTDSDESLDGYEEERVATKGRKERARVDKPGNQSAREQQRLLRDEGEEGWQDPGWIFNIALQIFL